MSDTNFASFVDSLIGGTTDTFLVCAGTTSPVAKKTAAEVRSLLGVYTTAQVDSAVASKIGGSVGATDNRLVRSDGTGTLTVQSTGITVDDSNNVSGVGTLACGAITASGTILAPNQMISVGGGGSYYVGATASIRLADYVNIKSGGDWGLMDVAPMTNLQSGLIRIYNDVQSTTNYERLEVGQQTAADAVVRTAAGGTGTRRGLTLDATTTTFIGNLTVNGGLSRFGASGGGYLEIPSNTESLVGYFAGSERGRISFGGGTGHDTRLLQTGATYLGSAASGNSVVVIGYLGANTTVRSHVLKTCDRSAYGIFTGAGHHLQITSGDPAGTDMAGGDVTVSGGRSTGTGLGGSIKFQTASAGTTGSSLNALVDRLTIDSTGAITVPTNAPLRFASSNHRIMSDNSSLFLESTGDHWFRLSGGTPYARVNQTNATAALRGMWSPTFCVATGGTTALAYLTTSGSDIVLRSDVGLKIKNLADSADTALTAGAITASGALNLAPITKAALLLLTPNAATGGRWRVTDATPASREAYPDGTNWRYTSDDTVVT